MKLQKYNEWKNAASLRLGQDSAPGRLALLHTAVVAGAQLVLALLTLWLEKGIASTGGLSGIGNRAVLQTAQTVLQYAVMILLPFWELGFLRAAQCFARGEEANAATLTAGLRRFAPALRLMLLKAALLTVLMVAAVNVASVIYSATPFAQPMMALIEPVMMAQSPEEMTQLMEAIPQEELLRCILPVVIMGVVLFFVAYIPIFYRIRFADYAVVDTEKVGAFAALRQSLRMTKGSALQLFRMDLSFWWFYLLQALVTALGFGDLLLQGLGVQADAQTLYIVFLCLQAAAQLLLYWKARAFVQTSYAAAYDDMKKGEA